MNSNYDFIDYIKRKCPDIQYSEIDMIFNKIKVQVEIFIDEYLKKYNDIKDIAYELSNYNKIVGFLTEEATPEIIDRYKSIDWNSFKILGGRWTTCSGRSPHDIKADMKSFANSRNYSAFVGCINELLGNCCISSIEDLED